MLRAQNPDFWLPLRKPVGTVRVNRNHPLGNGMIRAFMFSQRQGLVDIALGDILRPGANHSWSISKDGFGSAPNSVSASNTNGFLNSTTIPYAANGTIIVRACSRLATGATAAPFILDAQSSSNRTLIYRSGTTTNKWGWYLGGTVIFDTGAGEITDLFDHAVLTTVAFTWTSGNVQNVYKNGVLAGASPYGVTAAPVAQTVTVADRYASAAGTNTGLGGDLVYLYMYNRALDAAEVRQQYNHPYCMLQSVDAGVTAKAAAVGGSFQAAWARGSNVVLNTRIAA